MLFEKHTAVQQMLQMVWIDGYTQCSWDVAGSDSTDTLRVGLLIAGKRSFVARDSALSLEDRISRTTLIDHNEHSPRV